MPKNKGKGGKNRKRGKNVNVEEEKRELVLKEDGQEYAQVVRMLGNGRLEAQCFPETDARVLTDQGFLYLPQLEKRSGVLFACYDVKTASIVYRPGKLTILRDDQAAQKTVVEITDDVIRKKGNSVAHTLKLCLIFFFFFF
jgi:hypothetical protein